MMLRFCLLLIWIDGAYCCEQLIREQIKLIGQPRHSVKVNILLTTYEDGFRRNYSGEVSEYGQIGLQSKKLWEESCTPVENDGKLILSSDNLTLLKGEEVYSFAIHCDGDFIIGISKGQKIIGTFQYEYNIH